MDERRYADIVVVPDVVGMTVHDARKLASDAGVALAQPDPDGPPLGALTWPGVYVITEQHPSPGSQIYRWDSVRVRFRSADGPAGVREPRRPLPNPDMHSAAIDPDDPA